MELHRPRSHQLAQLSPIELKFPSVPVTDISHAQATAEITLPGIKAVLSPDFQASPRLSGFRASNASQESPRSIHSLPRIDPGPQDTNGQRRGHEVAVASPSELGSAMSIDEQAVRSPSISIENDDVRIAAEVLSGLGNPDFIRSPPTKQATESSRTITRPARTSTEEQEPLFQMFAKAHPWVGGTINGSLNAYSTTKNYSPRFVQYGAKIIEDRIALPVVSTVGTVGRFTGVESGMRWYYGSNTRRANDLENGGDDAVNKRWQVMDDEMEELPAYGPSKPPSYREEVSPPGMREAQNGQSQSWPAQMLVMTSSLGVALSETSRGSLQSCLIFLARQAEHITTVMKALKMVLNHYDQARVAWHDSHQGALEKGERPRTPDHDEGARRLAELIEEHSRDIWSTLQKVVTSVSSYAGGALPENARHFVRTQLLSMPQRWLVVSDNQTGDSETSRSAHRMLNFASEGLDMIEQVSQTMQLTLTSAEQWLDRVGRRRGTTSHTMSVHDSKDHEMSDAPHDRDVEKQ